MKSISLGKSDKYNSMPMEAVGPSPHREFYPSAFIEGVTLELPEEGTITFRYQVRRETTRPQENNKCDYDLDLLSIEEVKPGKSSKIKSTDDALNEYVKE